MQIEGISAVVTGSSRAIGREIARELARRGALVVCAARTQEPLVETVRLIEEEGGTAIAVPTDVTDVSQFDRLIDAAVEAHGRIHLLVNNAAAYRAVGGAWEVDADAWWRDVTTNLYGPFLGCRAALRHMMPARRGVIINMTGGGASSPMLGASAYGSSKAALMRLTDTLAAELGDESGIQVYCLDPGFVRSGISQHVAATAGGQKWLPYVKQDLEAGRDHPPDEVGRAVVALVEISTPALSGRVFSYRDDFTEIAERAESIRENDLRSLRLKHA